MLKLALVKFQPSCQFGNVLNEAANDKRVFALPARGRPTLVHSNGQAGNTKRGAQPRSFITIIAPNSVQ
ncbi:hypothetical protein IFU01_17780 [Oxalobacteraceae sp. CFBP 8763]|nr:hypothetical protein [Oxalobacteraceae sp. CFBP 8763]